jgi:catechol 2,3-dioxygenase-like lactoylglutathione lyase family enzyme
MFHATAMVRDYDATVERLAHLIGMRVLEYSEATDPAIGRRGGMTWIGDGSLELCEPIVEGAHPDRFVKRTGGGMQGVAVWVDDFPATAAHLESHGVEMPVQLPSGFGFSSPRATCGIQFEWADFTVDEDPRAGAPEPAFDVPPVLDVTELAFVGAVVDDPIAASRRLAELLGTRVTFEDAGAADGEPVAGVSVGDCVLALFRLVPGASEELWRRPHDRPRVSLLGVRVADLDDARPALAAAGAAVRRETVGMLVLDPDTTADVEIAVVDRLLPGDPRS